MRLAPPHDAENYKGKSLSPDQIVRYMLTHRVKFKQDGEWFDITVEEYLQSTDVLSSAEGTESFLTMFPYEYESYARKAIEGIRSRQE